MVAERDLAVNKILSNIGPIVGAKDGLVVASPSHRERDDLPDYYFTWTRDSALVFSALHQVWLLPTSSRSHASSSAILKANNAGPDKTFILFENLFRSYIASQATLQTIANPSGDLRTGGLSEPKFYVNGSAFLGDWGRPQRDGPALRALAIIPYAHYLLDRGYPPDEQYIRDNIYDPNKIVSPGKVVKNDLEEVAQFWAEASFDLWEELDGYHLFTYLVSKKALEEGAKLATRLNDSGAAEYYLEQVEAIQGILEQFWDGDRYYYISGIPGQHRLASDVFKASHNQVEKRKNIDLELELELELAKSKRGDDWPDRELLDCSLPLSIVHLNPSSASEVYVSRKGQSLDENGDHLFHPTDPRVLSTMYRYVLSFRGLYDINGDKNWTNGWMLGRYQEDLYDGVGKSKANPWFICTHSIAQVFYLAQTSFEATGFIQISNLTAPFWSDILHERITPGDRWTQGNHRFKKAIRALGDVGDEFLETSRVYWDGEGAMSEQVDRNNGHQRGARDLTWSYASFMTAVNARGNL
ncbi:hypothetical protein IAT40_003188 [Kwoniella sp. CBS 6097]